MRKTERQSRFANDVGAHHFKVSRKGKALLYLQHRADLNTEDLGMHVATSHQHIGFVDKALEAPKIWSSFTKCS